VVSNFPLDDSLERRTEFFWDSALTAVAEVWGYFVENLHQRGLVEFRRKIVGQVGAFVVPMKGGKLELIVAARRLSAALPRPPRSQLASSASLVVFQVPEQEELSFSSQDIADCFYQFRVPAELRLALGLRPVSLTARRLSGVDIVDGVAGDDDLVHPCLTMLPIGFSWALHWTQEAHRYLLETAGMGGKEREFVDKQPPPSRRGKTLAGSCMSVTGCLWRPGRLAVRPTGRRRMLR
jgi:hypothetical protein